MSSNLSLLDRENPQPDLGEIVLRTTWIAQAICALPTFLYLGILAYAELFRFDIAFYYFM